MTRNAKKFGVNLHGVEMILQDHPDSSTLPYIVRELEFDQYGLEQIKLTPNDTFLDVGANMGVVGIYAHMKFGCKVIAFEPVRDSYYNLLANIQHNGLNPDMFETWNFAVTDSDTEIITINYTPSQSGNASAFIGSGMALACPTMRLRRFLDPTPAYLCMDVEGAETAIIEDCKDLLWDIPYIGIEVHPYDGKDPQQTLDRLKSLTRARIFSTVAGT